MQLNAKDLDYLMLRAQETGAEIELAWTESIIEDAKVRADEMCRGWTPEAAKGLRNLLVTFATLLDERRERTLAHYESKRLLLAKSPDIASALRAQGWDG